MMTQEEIYQKFGDVPLTFVNYYKYSFTFQGEKDNVVILASVGGSSDDIYRFSFNRDTIVTLNKNLHSYMEIKMKDNEILYSGGVD